MARFRNPNVGVGADNPIDWIGQRFFEDEDARKRREILEDEARAQELRNQGMLSSQAPSRVQQEREFTPDPGRWLQQRAEDVRHNPIVGGLRALTAIPEAAATAARYATGVALAPVQAGAERYGWNAPEAVNRTGAESANLPGADLPVFGGLERGAYTLGGSLAGGLGTAARTGTDLLTGGVPQQRGSLAGQHLNETGFWETPVPTWENPFDPREALQRSRSLAGPGEMAPELAAGNVPFGMMAKGLSGLAGRAGESMMPGTSTLESVHGNPLADFFAPGKGNLGAFIPPVAGAVAGAVSPLGLPEGQDPTTEDRLLHAGEGLLLGMVGGMGASALEKRLVNVAAKPWQSGAMTQAIIDSGGSTRVARDIIPEMMESNAKAQGYEGRALTPGGPVQRAMDGMVAALYDQLRPVGTAMAWVEQEAASRGMALPSGSNFFLAMAQTRDIKQKMSQMVGQVTKEIDANGGGIYTTERDVFNVYGQFRTMMAAAEKDEPTFMGSYKKLYESQVASGVAPDVARDAVRNQLATDASEFGQALPTMFKGHPDVNRRFENQALGLSRLNDLAMDQLAEAQIITPDLALSLKGKFGDQYGYLVEASTQFTQIAARKGAPQDYLARQRGPGTFHSAEEMPAYTIQDQLLHARNAVGLAEHNKATLVMAEDMHLLGETNAAGKFIGIPGFMEPGTMRSVPVPGPATYERQVRDAAGKVVLDPMTGKPQMETVNRVGATAYRMEYDTHVPKDMGIIPYRKIETEIGDLGNPIQKSVHHEMLVEKSIAEALNSANANSQNVITSALAAQARFFAKGVTSASPFFWAMHATRQVQEFMEKTPRGEMGRAWNALFHSMYSSATAPMAEFAQTHPNNPIIQSLPGKMAAAADRGFGGDAARAVRDLFHEHGGGSSSLPASLSTPQSAAQAFNMKAGPGWQGNLPQGIPAWLKKPVDLWMDLGQAATSLGDEIPRVASFDVAVQAGMRKGLTRGEAIPEALAQARGSTNDYSRFGWAGQLINSVLPLSNARKEGFITSMSGAFEDPQRFATRMSMYVGMPAVTLYAANRLAYGDAYDDISVPDRDMYFHVPIGWWQDEYGRDHPLTFKIIKSPFIQAITAPLEQLLDSQYHLANDGEYLAEHQRTRRPDQRMWLTSLLRVTPLEGQPDMAADIHHLAMSAASMQPLGSMVVELASNEDHFTGRPMIPPEKKMIPPQFQYGIGTSMTAKFAGKYLHQSPGVIDTVAEGMFGTAGRAAMHVPDLAVGILQKHGLVADGDPFAPTTPADLPDLAGQPPEIVNRYLDQMQHEDMRPWQAQFFPRFFGVTYSGRSVMERAKQLGPEERHMWEGSLEYDRRSREIRAQFSAERASLEERAPDITNAAYRDKLWQLTMQEKGARNQLARDYAGKAWTSPEERQAAILAMPGVNADNFQKSLPNLPQGTDVAGLAQQWEKMGAAGNPPTVASMRNKWLAQQSQALHVTPGTILDYLGSYHLGNELVGLPVPAEDMERLRIDHAAPVDPKDPNKQLDPFTTPADKFREGQRAAITRYSQMWNMPEGKLLERLNARYHLPGDPVGPTQAAQQNASAMETRFHNPAEYPRYADPHGKAVGTPDDWLIWDQQLDDARNKYGNSRTKWPSSVRTLDDSRRYGNANRYMDMYRHVTDGTPEEKQQGLKNLMDWERFYGTGRNMTLTQWEHFMSDGQTKYKANISPQTAFAWDAILQIYRLLPPGPEKRKYESFATYIHKAANPRYLRIIDERDEIGSEINESRGLTRAAPSRLPQF